MVQVITVSGGSGLREAPKKQAKTTKFVFLLGFTAVLGGFLFGYDTGVVSSAMVYASEDLGLEYSEQQLIISMTIAFCTVFSLVGGVVNEYAGRKLTIMAASLLFAIGSIILALSGSFVVMLIGRGIVGIAIGFASMTVPPYVAECAPFHVRGTMVLGFQLMITFGIFMASIFGGIFSQPIFNPKTTGWRLMFGTAAVPAIIQFVAFFFLPESPRWLVAHKKREQAKAVLNRMYSDEDKAWREYEFAEIVDQQEQIEIEQAKMGNSLAIVSMLRTPHVRRALLLGCAIQLFQQLGGINTLMYYTATIIRMSGVRSAQTSIWLSCGITGINFVFTIVPTLLVERMGRRPLLLASTLGVILSLFILGGGFFGIYETAPEISSTMDLKQLRHDLDHHKWMNSSFYNYTAKEREDLWTSAQDCAKKTKCDLCVTPETCGFCYLNTDHLSDIIAGNNTYGMCLPSRKGVQDQSWVGLCSNKSSLGEPGQNGTYTWQWDYCQSPISWIVLVGMVLYLIAFSIGMGPIAWVINAEVYPNWARTTGVSVATAVNWAANTLVAQTFLDLTEAVTKFGTFLLFAGITIIGLIVFYVFVPETKGLQIEEVENLFKTEAERNKDRQRRDTAISNSKEAFTNGLDGEKELGSMKF